jgi:tetraprenyl-beta-curcumene synthase
MLSEQRLAIRTGAALVLANVRYWKYVAPQVRQELQRWARRAKMIPDARLREMAVGKLQLEHFNSEVAATLATLAGKAHRRRTVEAIVAFEVLYDYLDGVTEQPRDDPLESGGHLYDAFTAIFDEECRSGGSSDALGVGSSADEDGGYAAELSSTVREALATLPARSVVARAGRRAAERCADSQIRVHAVPQIGVAQLEAWARLGAAVDPALEWREYLAGAVASVLAVHALIVASADDRVIAAEADAIETAYLSIAAVSTMLDSLIDYERDLAFGDPWLVALYGGHERLGDHLTVVTQRAVAQAKLLPRSGHHLMTLLGVVAYYTSAADARSDLARPLVLRLHRELQPIIVPTLAVMRAWRLAKRARKRLHAGAGPRPLR